VRDATRRRDFIHLACANAAYLGLLGLRSAARKPKPTRRAVTVHAHVGEIFPPLALVRRMGDCTRTSFQVLGGGSGRQATDDTEVIHAGIRMTEFDVRHRGNLSRAAQEAVLLRLKAEVEKQFEWRISRATFATETHSAFCYPYLENAEGTVVFCRLEIKDYVPADRARKAGVESCLQQV
jgi:hypothetical protein